MVYLENNPAKAAPLRWLLVAWGGLLSLWPAMAAPASVPPPLPPPRDGAVEWARLEMDYEYWNRHAEYDHLIMRNLLRFTSLPLHPEMRTASAKSLDTLSPYPFIYTKTIAALKDPEIENLAEYLRRGGFILINACRNPKINPEKDVFLREQIQRLETVLPGLRTEAIPPDHSLFTCYFQVAEHPDYPRSGTPAPFTALFDGDRLIGIINLFGLKCLWGERGPQLQARLGVSHDLLANIYVYAMTH